MRPNLKAFTLLLFLLLFFSRSQTKLLAQGTFGCISGYNLGCFTRFPTNCDFDYIYDSSKCLELSQTDCDIASFPCTFAGGPTPPPSSDTTTIFCDGTGIRTAIGCIHANTPKALIRQVVGWTLGIATVAAFITIIYAGFIYTTSAGDVKKTAQAKSFLVSALSGLFIIAVSVVLLNFIGVSVLGLNIFGFSL